MAYNLSDRFPKLPEYYPLLDPGTYEKNIKVEQNVNTKPFLSTSPRVTNHPHKIWTQVIYFGDRPPKIPNGSTMQSRAPRFPYEVLKEESLSKLICKCGIDQRCECLVENVEKNVRTEEKKIPRIFKGHPPRTDLEKYESLKCSKEKRTAKKTYKNNFYGKCDEARESTDYYKGCKWSHWTSKRNTETLSESPGPTTYTIKQELTHNMLCSEKIKALRRKNSKQYRFIETVQQKNLHDNFPGPATYTLRYPRGTDLQFLGPKAKRFDVFKIKVPGPSDYEVRRDFDMPKPLEKRCNAVLHKRSAFGVKAPRFKLIKTEGPGPASYDINHENCIFKHCPMVPFGSSSIRFSDDAYNKDITDNNADICIRTEKPSLYEKSRADWMFKSKTIRMPPLKKDHFKPSQADLPLKNFSIVRSSRVQDMAPFGTLQPRFQPWYNYIPVYNTEDTPGPGEYKLDKMSCLPAVAKGPVIRTERFKLDVSQAPPCNAYKIGYGIEKVLNTYNKNLKDNVNKKRQYHCKERMSMTKISNKERESLLINYCISLLNTDIFEAPQSFCIDKHGFSTQVHNKNKTKMLRCFMYKHVFPNYY